MAKYQRPPDPRKPVSDELEQHLRREKALKRESIPWIWLGLGVIVTLIGIGLAVLLISAVLSRDPLPVNLPTPTILHLTAPAQEFPTLTVLAETPTPIPTFTPPPTPDLSIAPEALTVGFYAQVANTDDIGVSLRAGPSTDNLRLQLVPEGSYFLVLGGPEEASGFIWWQGRLEDGIEGWIAGDFLVPAAAPNGTSQEP